MPKLKKPVINSFKASKLSPLGFKDTALIQDKPPIKTKSIFGRKR